MWFTIIIFASLGQQSYAILTKFIPKSNDSVLTLNNDCEKQLQAYISELGSRKLWALKMLDASAKIQSGFYQGNFYNLGNFYECLKIQEQTSVGLITGKYCLASLAIDGTLNTFGTDMRRFKGFGRAIQPHIVPESVHAQYGYCVPATCTANDINSILSTLSINGLQFNDSYCQTTSAQTKLTTGDMVVINTAAVLVLILFVSTVYDLYMDYLKSDNKYQALILFSILTNGRKLFTVDNNTKQLTCLAGIRTITLMWIILSHGFLMVNFRPFTNYRNVYEWTKQTSSMIIISGQLSVDTFFMLSGTVLLYVFINYKRNFKMVHIPMFYLHRYLRIVPALLALIIVHLTVIKHFGSGPLWTYSSALIGNCDTYWWRLLLFTHYNNKECIPVSWYLVCDMQLFFLSPLILIPLQKWPRLVLKLVVVLIIGSTAYSFFLAWYYEMTPFLKDERHYTSTLVRGGPWLIGMILGYAIHHYQSLANTKLNKMLIALLWIASLSIMTTCIFAGKHLADEPRLYPFQNILHMGLVKPVWCIAVGWVIFACVIGYGVFTYNVSRVYEAFCFYGKKATICKLANRPSSRPLYLLRSPGPINSFLSLPIFQFLSKLGYCMYLLHYSILITLSLSARSAVVESNTRELYVFWSNYMLTIALSIIWSLTFESPVIALEKYAFENHKKTTNSVNCDTSNRI